MKADLYIHFLLLNLPEISICICFYFLTMPTFLPLAHEIVEEQRRYLSLFCFVCNAMGRPLPMPCSAAWRSLCHIKWERL